MRSMFVSIPCYWLGVLLCIVSKNSTPIDAAQQQPSNRLIHMASPLQSLTIWDPNVLQEKQTRRDLFLRKFRAGLQAEVDARQTIVQKEQEDATTLPPYESVVHTTNNQNHNQNQNPNWAQQVAAMDRAHYYSNEKLIERAYDQAIQQVEEEIQQEKKKNKRKKQLLAKTNQHQYQFVGVINPNPMNTKKGTAAATTTTTTTTKPPITWYSRKKPKHAQWTIRLVHVNRDAIIQDLFKRGKIDIFAQYTNTGRTAATTTTTTTPTTAAAAVSTDSTSATSTTATTKQYQPVITSHYTVRQKSWKNLWNFSLKHMITDSSGMYWRERRLRPGLYTDGSTVYEASYRYRDGRNGMHRISTFQQYLNSKSVDPKLKQQILKRLKEDIPDIVLEE